ncbi:DUF1697 domain-containing protein [Desulforamulus ferrireducens]|uniref:DUF1697 domain-containing protein n=1 Tax=Desulforamulus ferrireducens TaxID=1833852 RepID=A0A1S6ISH1_9FIRM|nr:DUF1697 domain-containing protein [Desulforamulus ferrireducens]AQS57718.1 hypothetical protein B0537_00385 [Desulforamulus ferrireducens]
MIYVALLRGINVGGKNKIDMKLLKETFRRVGMKSVVTYINSGNVIFVDDKHTKDEIAELLEKGIFDDFNLRIKVLIRSLDAFEKMMSVLPASWSNDNNMRADVLFLWDEVDQQTARSQLVIKPDIDTVLFFPGGILWAVDRKNVTRSGLTKVVGTDLYRKITVRNVNTTRKIYEMMKELNKSCE